MKKNILLVQSFLVLPLLTSSFVFSAQNKSYAQVARGTQLPLKKTDNQSLKSSGSQKRNKRKNQPAPQATKVVIEETVETPIPAVEQFDAIIAAAPAIIDEQVVAQEPVKAQIISKYLISELTPEEIAHAKNDLEKAQSYAKNIAVLLSEISSQGRELRHVEQETKKSAPAVGIKIELTEDLEKSVMNPAQNKSLGLSHKIWSAFRTYRANVIDFLSADTFEPTNATHKEYFNLALEECAAQKDMKSLTEILDLCHKKEKYNSLQSAINHVAPAFNFMADDFASTITASNKALLDYNQQCATEINQASKELQENLAKLLNGHREKVTAIAQLYNAKVDSAQAQYTYKTTAISTIAALNAKVEQHKNALLFEHTLNIPTNAVAAIEHETHTKVRQLMTNNCMPQARTTILQLTDK